MKLENLAKKKNGRVRLPGNLESMERSRTLRPDLESNIYLQYRYRRDVQKLKISFNWFVAAFRNEFKKAGEPVPSTGKIHRFLSRWSITLQAVRETQKKTVAERIDKVDPFNYVRKVSSSKSNNSIRNDFGRTSFGRAIFGK